MDRPSLRDVLDANGLPRRALDALERGDVCNIAYNPPVDFSQSMEQVRDVPYFVAQYQVRNGMLMGRWRDHDTWQVVQGEWR